MFTVYPSLELALYSKPGTQPEGSTFPTVPLGPEVGGTPKPAGAELVSLCLLRCFPNYSVQKDDHFRHCGFSLSALSLGSLPILPSVWEVEDKVGVLGTNRRLVLSPAPVSLPLIPRLHPFHS